MQEPLPSSIPDDTLDTHTEPPRHTGSDHPPDVTDIGSGVVDGPSNTTDVEDLSAGLRTINLNTQQSCDQDKGASGQSDEVPDFHSLPVMKPELEAPKEPEKNSKKTVAGFFRSLSLRGTSSTKEKKKVYEEKTNEGNTKKQKRPSLGHRLRQSLSMSGRKRPALETS
ncbi:uncharacterized protein [Branchiostoma lanceolatum]|uniref:uncharacterized protein isoform X2 n=1 Tax=Branchiostoma lanceolatum TaxID=7740 RepID=UPI0034528D2F